MNQLYQHQKNFLDFNAKRHVLVWGTGTGKTRTALEWAKKHGQETIIIVPKALMTNWERAIFQWTGEKVLLKEPRITETKSFLLTTKEYFRDHWDEFKFYDSIIIDEAHYFLGIKSQMHKHAMKFLKKHKPQYVLALTATPFLSSPFNIMALGKILGKASYIWDYNYFLEHYFVSVNMSKSGSGYSKMVPVVKSGVEKEMAKRIAAIGNVVKMEDCVDVPEEVFVEEFFQMTTEQAKLIDNLLDTTHIARWTKTHQITCGGLKGDEYTDTQYVSCDKFDRAIDLALGTEKIVIVCRYNHEIDRFAEALKGKKNFSIINGAEKDKQSVLDAANKSDEHVLLVNASCSEGWEAKTFDTMMFYSYDFSLKNYIQMKGRIQRIDAIQKCTYISLLTEKTIDEDVYENVVKKKQDFHLAIYNK